MTATATVLRDLRTGRSIWEQGARAAIASQPAEGTIETDVLVVGAGISGAILADVLSEAGFKVALVDRRGPVRGSTVATTALIQGEIDLPLLKLANRIGDKNAARAWLRSQQAVAALARRAVDIPCEWRTRPSLFLAGSELEGHQLAEEADARAKIGFPAEYIDSIRLRQEYGIERGGAIRSQGQADANPILLSGGLLHRSVSRGARIYGPAEIINISEMQEGVTALTQNECVIKASALIYATGYEVPKGVTQPGRVISTWAIATKRQAGLPWPTNCLIWEASDPYLYMRTTADGRVIAGGEDEDFETEESRDALVGEKTRVIQRKLHALFPHIDTTVDYAWTGSFGSSDSGLPSIGRMPGSKHCFAVLGFGGNGITFAMIAAQILCAELLGTQDPDSDLFAFR